MEEGKYIEILDINLDEVWTIQSIIDKLEELEISNITIANDIIINYPDKIVKIIKTDKEHPFIVKNGILYINEDYFLEHSQEIHDLITFLCSKTKDSGFEISNKELIPENIIETALQNENIDKLYLVAANSSLKEKPEEQQYILTEENYKKIKSAQHHLSIYTSNVEDKLKDNFDPIIGFNSTKKLIGSYTYEDLQDNKFKLSLNRPISTKELQNFKYINPSKEIIIESENNETIEKILKAILSSQLNNKIIIKVKDKEKFNQSNMFKNSTYEDLNIFIHYSTQTIPLGLYKKTEQTMYTFLSPIKDKDYSPFEKFIYVYNMTKRFKKYKEVDENNNLDIKFQSRNLHEILFNNYMVCVGYAEMFIDFLNKIGIHATEESISVAVNKEGEELATDGHARVISHIVDQKYNIDGYYVSDPTWDNSIEYDFYNHLVLTSKEVNREPRKHMSDVRQTKYGILQDPKDIMFSETLDEFYNKINYIINKKMNKYIKDCKTRKQVYKAKEEIIDIYVRILNDILNSIKEIDEEKYKEITSKYEIPNSKYDAKAKFTEEFSKIITEIANYVVPMTNKTIPASTIIDAAMVVNKNVLNLNDKQEEEYRNYLIDINQKMQSLAFPKRTIENATTGEVTYQNEENKFDSIYPQISGKTL